MLKYAKGERLQDKVIAHEKEYEVKLEPRYGLFRDLKYSRKK